MLCGCAIHSFTWGQVWRVRWLGAVKAFQARKVISSSDLQASLVNLRLMAMIPFPPFSFFYFSHLIYFYSCCNYMIPEYGSPIYYERRIESEPVELQTRSD
jgi:hypothetical protein